VSRRTGRAPRGHARGCHEKYAYHCSRAGNEQRKAIFDWIEENFNAFIEALDRDHDLGPHWYPERADPEKVRGELTKASDTITAIGSSIGVNTVCGFHWRRTDAFQAALKGRLEENSLKALLDTVSPIINGFLEYSPTALAGCRAVRRGQGCPLRPGFDLFSTCRCQAAEPVQPLCHPGGSWWGWPRTAIAHPRASWGLLGQ
jgi:hypothetical protein